MKERWIVIRAPRLPPYSTVTSFLSLPEIYVELKQELKYRAFACL
jgi:hypothetical protein